MDCGCNYRNVYAMVQFKDFFRVSYKSSLNYGGCSSDCLSNGRQSEKEGFSEIFKVVLEKLAYVDLGVA